MRVDAPIRVNMVNAFAHMLILDKHKNKTIFLQMFNVWQAVSILYLSY